MKRSSCPQNEAGPSQKRLADNTTKRNDAVKQCFDRVHTHGNVIWSGTMESHDVHSQKIVFDCSVKALPQDEGIKSFFPEKQLTIPILPASIWLSLLPYNVQSRRSVLCMDENTDMKSYSAFSQVIRFGRNKMGCTVLKSSASALHLLHVFSFSYEHEDYFVGVIVTYQAKDTVHGILRSHGLLPCVNQEHNELVKKNKMLKEELVKLHLEVEEQKKLAEKKQEELATSQNERDMMKKAISEKDVEIIVKDITMMENDEALKRKDREMLSLQQKYFNLQNEKEKYRVLEKEKTELEEELECKVQMVEKKEGKIVSLQGDMEEKIKLIEEQKMKLTEMEKKMEEMNTKIREKDNALGVKDPKLMTLQKNQHKLKTSCSGMQNEVAMKQAGMKRMMEKEGECSICKGLFIKATTLNCFHSFCDYCIRKWLRDNTTCPCCREEIKYRVPCIALDNLIQGMVDQCGNEMKRSREAAVEEREREVLEAGQLYSDSENSSQSDDDTSSGTHSSSSTASSWEQISVNECFTPFPSQTEEL